MPVHCTTEGLLLPFENWRNDLLQVPFVMTTKFPCMISEVYQENAVVKRFQCDGNVNLKEQYSVGIDINPFNMLCNIHRFSLQSVVASIKRPVNYLTCEIRMPFGDSVPQVFYERRTIPSLNDPVSVKSSTAGLLFRFVLAVASKSS